MQTKIETPCELNYKTCTKCKGNKPDSEFNFRCTAVGLRQSYCKECGKELTRAHYQNNKRQYLDRNVRSYLKRRELVRQIKSRECADCGIQYPFYVMDFDHREGESKQYELNRIDRMTTRAVLREARKCDVVCANCHRERTYRRVKLKGAFTAIVKEESRMKTAIDELMQKYSCETSEELEEKRLEFCRNIKMLEGMINANRRRDFEYANKLGIEMDKFAAQVSEIEEATRAYM